MTMGLKVFLLFIFITQTCSVDPVIKTNRDFFEKYLLRLPDSSEGSEATFQTEVDGLTEFAPCQLKELPVAVPKHRNPSLNHWPSHVLMKRCFGGCPLRKFACKPTVHKVMVKLMVTKPVGAMFESEGQADVEMEEHTSCSCVCKELASECGATKNYVPDLCECRCKEVEECADDKAWDKKACRCQCRSVQECPGRQLFSTNSCKCVSDSSLDGSNSGSSDQIPFDHICPQMLCPPPQIVALGPDPCVCKFG